MTYEEPVEIETVDGRQAISYSHCAACRTELRFGDDIVSIEFYRKDGHLGEDVMPMVCGEQSALYFCTATIVSIHHRRFVSRRLKGRRGTGAVD